MLPKKTILEVNPLLPWGLGGYDELVHISEVDSIVEFESRLNWFPLSLPRPR